MAGIQIVERHRFLRFDHETYTAEKRNGYEARYQKLLSKDIHSSATLDMNVMNSVAEGTAVEELNEFLSMSLLRPSGSVRFTSFVWQRLFAIKGPLVRELIFEFFSTFEFVNNHHELRRANTIRFQLGGEPRSMTMVQFMIGMGLHTEAEVRTTAFTAYYDAGERKCPEKSAFAEYWASLSNEAWTDHTPSYKAIREPLKRLVHRLISCSIACRAEGKEKVNAHDLFYLRSMDDGPLVNVPFCLANYLRSGATGRKRTSAICGGQFVSALATHFGLLTPHHLHDCTIVTPPMQEIGMAGLIELDICAYGPVGGLYWRKEIPVIHPDDDRGDDEDVEEQRGQGDRRRGTVLSRLGALEEEVRRLSLAIDTQRESIDMYNEQMYGLQEIHERDYAEFAAERLEARRFREWQAGISSTHMEHLHIGHTRYDGSIYSYASESSTPHPPETQFPQRDARDTFGIFDDPTQPPDYGNGYGRGSDDMLP